MTASDRLRTRWRLRIDLLGAFRVTRDGALLPEHEIGSRKARTLLKVLLVREGRLVPMDTLVEVLWEGGYVLLRLRWWAIAVMGSVRLVGGRGGYRFVSDESVEVDLAEARRLTAQPPRRRRTSATTSSARPSACVACVAVYISAPRPLGSPHRRQSSDGLDRRPARSHARAAPNQDRPLTALQSRCNAAATGASTLPAPDEGSILVQLKEQVAATTVVYDITGTLLEACSCGVLCPAGSVRTPTAAPATRSTPTTSRPARSATSKCPASRSSTWSGSRATS